eukprot:CAMPEP_0170867218 /NCGR_PEP_ID=MMETSP0734-20130129/22626_1 /TAXON_ID=186038 /ORGANISM="Fragilariopsis kerguelensis, Strain L26-C5" /LENGTH=157 /DNA_ID=CAMNT_0011244343 /DNA_START=22 /DNA_END=495 /DNA_ORIENTATION=-
MRSDALNLEMPDFLSVLLVRVPARLVRLVRLVVPRELALDEKRLMSESRRLPPPMETVFNESRCCRTLKSFTADPTSRFIFSILLKCTAYMRLPKTISITPKSFSQITADRTKKELATCPPTIIKTGILIKKIWNCDIMTTANGLASANRAEIFREA